MHLCVEKKTQISQTVQSCYCIVEYWSPYQVRFLTTYLVGQISIVNLLA
jgi:hypothetical protein